jgi:hypothetical protein
VLLCDTSSLEIVRMTRVPTHLAFVTVALLLAACDESVPPTGETTATAAAAAAAAKGGSAVVLLNRANSTLAAMHKNFRVAYAEWVTTDGAQDAGQIVFADDVGNKHTGAHFVAGDPRRGGRDFITYLVDQSDGATHSGTGLTNAQTEAAIDRALHTWDVTTTCSKLPIVKVSDNGQDPDLIDGLSGFGGVGTPFADITDAGWMPAGFFDLFAPNGSEFILGITFTFVFVDDGGNPTDINHDGELDTWFHETYYNDAFEWGIDTDNSTAIDVESVALHESGHGLDQAHFGKIFGTVSNLRLHIAPLAVMNAAIVFPLHSLLGTDMAGHCSLWGSWPSR